MSQTNNTMTTLRAKLIELASIKQALREATTAMSNIRETDGAYKAVTAKRQDAEKDKAVSLTLEHIVEVVTDCQELAIAGKVANKVMFPETGETFLQTITSTLIEYRVYSRVKNRSQKEVTYKKVGESLTEAKAKELEVTERYGFAVHK